VCKEEIQYSRVIEQEELALTYPETNNLVGTFEDNGSYTTIIVNSKKKYELDLFSRIKFSLAIEV
jgi:hypothetical protein